MDYLKDHDIIQVCIVVKDIEKTLDKYISIFGIERPQIKKVSSYDFAKTTYRGQPSNAQPKLCSFSMGAISLELVEPDNQPSVWREFYDKHGEGVCYLGLWIGDEQETFDFLQVNGISILHTGKTMTGSYNCTDSETELGVIFNLKYKRP